MEAASWKGSRGTALLCDEEDATFARRLISDLAAGGNASVALLRVDGNPSRRRCCSIAAPRPIPGRPRSTSSSQVLAGRAAGRQDDRATVRGRRHRGDRVVLAGRRLHEPDLGRPARDRRHARGRRRAGNRWASTQWWQANAAMRNCAASGTGCATCRGRRRLGANAPRSLVELLRLRLIFSENQFPPWIQSGAGFRDHALFRLVIDERRDRALQDRRRGRIDRSTIACRSVPDSGSISRSSWPFGKQLLVL